jgi:tetratricopeptide (TPR) repeat protein
MYSSSRAYRGMETVPMPRLWAGIAAGFVAACLGAGAQAADRAAANHGSTDVQQHDADAEQPPADSKQHIDELIRQLGNPRFTVRRAAANELDKIGPEAFDQLYAASGDADPEVAASSRYVLRQINVRWTRSDDSAKVRMIFRSYGDEEDDDRKRAIAQLSALEGGEGIAGLCRIARFDRSPLVSRIAALVVIVPADHDDSEPAVDPEIIDYELGASTRPAALWLRQYQIQLRDPAASVSGWQKLVDEEVKRLGTSADETSTTVASDLLWNLADVYRRLGDTPHLLGVVDRMMGIGGDDADDLLVHTLQSFVDHQSWEALDQFVTKYESRIEQTKAPLYLVALARAQQGNKELAEQLAERASKLDPKQPLSSFEEAHQLASLGQVDWAVREYHQTIDGQPAESPVAIPARVLLSRLLEDYERYQEAADALEPLVKGLEKNRDRFGQQYENVQRIFGERESNPVDLPEPSTLGPHRHFLLACALEQQQDWVHQREHLLQALSPGDHDGGVDGEDADVLIAMYRSQSADDAWRADTLKRIETLAQAFEQQIEQSPNVATNYNQWAWLISNTEGDKQKAIRYSQHSLELLADTRSRERSISSQASFLDTLGRCYFAVGDYENAIKKEREAIRLIPHMQVMQRQLEMFEKAVAEKGGAGKAEGGGS